MSKKMTNSEAISNLNHIYGIVSPNIQRSLDVAFKAMDRQQGEWINPYLSSTTGEFSARCNICGEDITVSSSHHNFCPNCGAEMRKGEKTNEL